LDQEFAGVRRRLLSGGIDGVDGVGRNPTGFKKSCFFFGAVSRINLGNAIS
jgi:hypothetical protein